MKKGVLSVVLSTALLMLLVGCGGGGGGSDGGSGTLSVDVTDAKPVISGDPTEVWITFEEVRAHKSGGGWVTLALKEKPLSINLLAFSQDGTTTELVPPAQLESGHYTQLRFEVSEAYMVIGGDPVPIDLDVPSGFLRIDKDFTFDVPDGGAVGLTVDFDLSQSIVDEGNGTYKLKPVLHLVETDGAATIHGTITKARFGASTQVEVTVIYDFDGIESTPSDDQEYTKVVVTQDPPGADTTFSIFWLVPSQNYIVEVRQDSDADGDFDTVVSTRYVSSDDLQPGEDFDLGSI